MTPHPVDSHKHLLSEQDILLVAAHSTPHAARQLYEESGKPEGVSPERLMHAVLYQLYQDPKQIRLRHGNTIFLLTPLTEDAALVSMLDGDVRTNLPANLIVGAAAMQKMGYRTAVLKLLEKEPGNRRIADMAKRIAKDRGWKLQMHGSAIVVGLV